MEPEHEGAGGALLEIRELTRGFEYPSYAIRRVNKVINAGACRFLRVLRSKRAQAHGVATAHSTDTL